ncbi:hypothetical protein [Phnomibacter sp.]|uniref:hypothetical protein n=1 Tax=Phnomibacter sp. TaxID=2836217 RepID=UPI002FDE7419
MKETSPIAVADRLDTGSTGIYQLKRLWGKVMFGLQTNSHYAQEQELDNTLIDFLGFFPATSPAGDVAQMVTPTPIQHLLSKRNVLFKRPCWQYELLPSNVSRRGRCVNEKRNASAQKNRLLVCA